MMTRQNYFALMLSAALLLQSPFLIAQTDIDKRTTRTEVKYSIKVKIDGRVFDPIASAERDKAFPSASFSWSESAQPDNTITLEKGVAQLAMNSSFEQVIEHFGKPSVRLSQHQNQQVWAYGRKLWFYFQDGQLKAINNKNNVLSGAARNLISQRPVFDDIDWNILNGLKLESLKSEATDLLSKLDSNYQTTWANDTLSITKDDVTLQLYFTPYINMDAERNLLLERFQMVVDNYTPSQKFNINQTAYSVSELLAVKEQSDLDPLGVIYLNSGHARLILNNSQIIKVGPTKLTDIHLLDYVFRSAPDQSNSWRLPESISKNTTLTRAQDSLANDAFYFDGELEYETKAYDALLYFYRASSEERLYEAHLALK